MRGNRKERERMVAGDREKKNERGNRKNDEGRERK